MNPVRLSTAFTLATALSLPGLAIAQTEDHDQHHPATAAETAPAAAESETAGMAEAQAEPTERPSGGAPEMMGSAMMNPGMMRMMQEMMRGAMSKHAGSGTMPIVIVVPVPMAANEVRPGGRMHAEMMSPAMTAMMQGGDMGRSGILGMSVAGMLAEVGSGVVVPAIHLSAEDVRHFLEHRLERHKSSRLTTGEITEADEDVILAEIATVDGSLVERLRIHRHSGLIERAS